MAYLPYWAQSQVLLSAHLTRSTTPQAECKLYVCAFKKFFPLPLQEYSDAITVFIFEGKMSITILIAWLYAWTAMLTKGMCLFLSFSTFHSHISKGDMIINKKGENYFTCDAFLKKKKSSRLIKGKKNKKIKTSQQKYLCLRNWIIILILEIEATDMREQWRKYIKNCCKYPSGKEALQ